MAKHMHYSAFC